MASQSKDTLEGAWMVREIKGIFGVPVKPILIREFWDTPSHNDGQRSAEYL